LQRFRARTEADRSVAHADLDAIDLEAAALIDTAVRDAKAAPPPVEADLTSDVYIQY
jgi:pyruvate dehydrogenase E1 component alpha subunit